MHFSGFLFKTFRLIFILFLDFLLIHLDHKIKQKLKVKEKQNNYSNRRQITESPPPDFSQGHSWILYHHLHSPPSCSLFSSLISALPQPQSFPTRLCSSSGPLLSPKKTVQLLGTPSQVLRVPFQQHLESLSQIRYSLVVILELSGVSEVQYKNVMMIDDGKYQ